MCTATGPLPGSAAEALRMARAGLDYLNSGDAGELPAAGMGEVLTSLGELRAKLAAAQASFLRRFDAADAHDGDGYGSSSAWLAAKAGMTPAAAKAAVAQMRTLGRLAPLHGALAAGDLSESLAGEIARWLKELPAGLRAATSQVLVDAAAAGAARDDLIVIVAAALEKWRSGHPGPDGDDDGFEDRYVQVGTTFGGAGCIRGDLTPECAAAVQAVLEALGKKHGADDHRSEGQRFHDALQLGCELLIRARMVPARAGADTQVIAHIPLSQLRDLPGGSAIEAAWLSARAGQPGYLTGKDAETAACDAVTVPVVTGHADMAVIDRIIDLALIAIDGGGWHRPATTSPDNDQASPGTDTGTGGTSPGSAGTDCDPSDPGTGPDGDQAGAACARPGAGANDDPGAIARLALMSPEARDALRYAIARLAIDFVSGPNGLASLLRTGLLQPPYNTPSLPLDIGYAENIPAHIRRAVTLRDKHCAWPGCGKPVAWCDVHHIVHKQYGGNTSVTDCLLLCQFHHDVCIHRWGWRIVLHPDGTTSAYGPQGQVLHSHSPPTSRAG